MAAYHFGLHIFCLGAFENIIDLNTVNHGLVVRIMVDGAFYYVLVSGFIHRIAKQDIAVIAVIPLSCLKLIYYDGVSQNIYKIICHFSSTHCAAVCFIPLYTMFKSFFWHKNISA